MPTQPSTIPAAEALAMQTLITPTEQGIASRLLARTGGGTLTLFAFDAGQEVAVVRLAAGRGHQHRHDPADDLALAVAEQALVGTGTSHSARQWRDHGAAL